MLEAELMAKREERKALFKKKTATLRHKMSGMALFEKDWYRALAALEFGLKHHKGYRKDKITPTYMHQIEMALYAFTLLPHFMFPVRVIIAILLHDTPEDTKVSHEEVSGVVGAESAADVELLTKEYRGEKKEPDAYFGGIALSPVASIGKGIDRIHNQSTMVGVFTLERQVAYVLETKTYFFKFLKEARRRFPQQEQAYENIKFVLDSQLRVFEGAHAQGIAA